MKSIHWFEAKQLDRVTNFSTEVEIIKAANKNKIPFKYYCTFSVSKKYFDLDNNIVYLGVSNNKYIKYITFYLLIIFKSIKLVLGSDNNIIMVNQDLIKSVIPANYMNRLLGKSNKFIVDIRTTPTNPVSFDNDMIRLHESFKFAVKYFDGYSFITPFMEKYILEPYNSKKPSVNWSSGVDIDLFNYNNFKRVTSKKPFTLFYHGGISESRGNMTLVKACQLLKNKGLDLQLIQVGICVDNTIKKYIALNNLTSWCKLLPPVPLKEIPQYIANSDLPVLPFPDFMAWRVSSPIKLMEYLAVGKKVLAPNIEAFTEVFDGREDLIFYYDAKEKDQVNEIATKIEFIIKEGNLSNFRHDKAVNFVSKNITWEIQAKKLFNFCEKL